MIFCVGGLRHACVKHLFHASDDRRLRQRRHCGDSRTRAHVELGADSPPDALPRVLGPDHRGSDRDRRLAPGGHGPGSPFSRGIGQDNPRRLCPRHTHAGLVKRAASILA